MKKIFIITHERLKSTFSFANIYKSFFEQFAQKAKILKNNGNRYVTMLEREYDSDPRKKDFQGMFQKGAFLCYKVRGSIVHAGGTSLIFEHFEDGEEALLELVMPLEQAVLKYLEIDIQ